MESTAQSEDSSTDTLAAALARRGRTLTADRLAALERYCAALWEWNAKINLTRHVDFERFVARDAVDAWQIADALDRGERVLDVGSGGGAPGVILAIVRPDLKVSLTESVGKKARALEDIVRRTAVPATVYHSRAEEVLGSRHFNTLTIRAVAPLAKLLTWFRPHWAAFDRLLAVKGPRWVEERHEAREMGLLKNLQLRKLSVWPLPGADSESVLLEIRQKDAGR